METKINKEELLLHVGSSPHVRTENSTQQIMLTVIIALIPALIAGFAIFGPNALIVTLVSVVSCVLAELVIQKALKKPVRISDLSAVVTGILLAFNVPATMPLWMVALAGIFAIVIVKELFGGIGNNFVNPALAARAMLLASWSQNMGTLPQPFKPDAIAGPTPLSGGEPIELMDMLLGKMPGMLGEVSALALLIGAVILLWRGIIKLRIPAAMIGSFAVFYVIFASLTGAEGASFAQSFQNLPAQILSGGLILGAFFMATDYSSSPMTAKGQLIYGLGAGFITALIRCFGTYPEGVSYAILIMNVCTPLIDKYVKRQPFGGVQ